VGKHGAIETCALGAAGLAIGGDTERLATAVIKHFGLTNDFAWKIAVRNDAGESREAIADWLCREGGCEHGESLMG